MLWSGGTFSFFFCGTAWFYNFIPFHFKVRWNDSRTSSKSNAVFLDGRRFNMSSLLSGLIPDFPKSDHMLDVMFSSSESKVAVIFSTPRHSNFLAWSQILQLLPTKGSLFESYNRNWFIKHHAGQAGWWVYWSAGPNMEYRRRPFWDILWYKKYRLLPEALLVVVSKLYLLFE